LMTIEHGVVFSPMHAWRGQLTDGEMQDVAESHRTNTLLRRKSE
jgi:nitrite reductase/ring-hydroxylating ferredoxin subunit